MTLETINNHNGEKIKQLTECPFCGHEFKSGHGREIPIHLREDCSNNHDGK